MAPIDRRVVAAWSTRRTHASATTSWAGPPGLPVPEFSRAVGDALTRAVPAEGTCLMSLGR
jgi:hypothetical protein